MSNDPQKSQRRWQEILNRLEPDPEKIKREMALAFSTLRDMGYQSYITRIFSEDGATLAELRARSILINAEDHLAWERHTLHLDEQPEKLWPWEVEAQIRTTLEAMDITPGWGTQFWHQKVAETAHSVVSNSRSKER